MASLPKLPCQGKSRHDHLPGQVCKCPPGPSLTVPPRTPRPPSTRPASSRALTALGCSPLLPAHPGALWLNSTGTASSPAGHCPLRSAGGGLGLDAGRLGPLVFEHRLPQDGVDSPERRTVFYLAQLLKLPKPQTAPALPGSPSSPPTIFQSLRDTNTRAQGLPRAPRLFLLPALVEDRQFTA